MRALANRFNDLRFDVVYTSALNRTMETAGPLMKTYSDAAVRQLADLDEMCWGVYEGEPWSDRLRAMLDDVYDRWNKGEFDYKVEEGESIIDVQTRCVRAVDHIVEAHAGETVLVVTHGRLLRVLLSTILDLGLDRMNEIDHTNTGVNVVTYCDGTYSSSLLNCTAHLDTVESALVE